MILDEFARVLEESGNDDMAGVRYLKDRCDNFVEWWSVWKIRYSREEPPTIAHPSQCYRSSTREVLQVAAWRLRD